MDQVAYIPNPGCVTIRKLINVPNKTFILYLYNGNNRKYVHLRIFISIICKKFKSIWQEQVHYFIKVTITKYYILGSLNKQHLFSHSSRG